MVKFFYESLVDNCSPLMKHYPKSDAATVNIDAPMWCTKSNFLIMVFTFSSNHDFFLFCLLIKCTNFSLLALFFITHFVLCG